MNQKPSSACYVPTNYEEHDNFTPKKRLKLDCEVATSKGNSFTSREDGITTREIKCQEEIEPTGGRKVEVHLANAELWKDLNAIGNEMRIDTSTR